MAPDPFYPSPPPLNPPAKSKHHGNCAYTSENSHLLCKVDVDLPEGNWQIDTFERLRDVRFILRTCTHRHTHTHARAPGAKNLNMLPALLHVEINSVTRNKSQMSKSRVHLRRLNKPELTGGEVPDWLTFKGSKYATRHTTLNNTSWVVIMERGRRSVSGHGRQTVHCSTIERTSATLTFVGMHVFICTAHLQLQSTVISIKGPVCSIYGDLLAREGMQKMLI